MKPVQRVVVALPARNEATLLHQCLTALTRAQRQLWQHHPRVGVDIVVALDCCTDDSAAVAAAHPVTSLAVHHGRVGSTRDAAITQGVVRAVAQGISPDAIWVACTDADTLVPRDWLSQQVTMADQGMDLILGTVQPGDDLDPQVRRSWYAGHQLTEGHPHIHGANLGVRASAWSAVGGFGPLAVHEDVSLAHRVKSLGAPWVATDRTRVMTSSRSTGRLTGGFASYLRELTPVAQAGS